MFRVSAIVNDATISMTMQILFQVSDFNFFGYTPSAGFHGSFFLFFWLCWVLGVARRLSCPTACEILVP